MDLKPYSIEETNYIYNELKKYNCDTIYPPIQELKIQKNWILWGVKIQRNHERKFVCLVDKVPFTWNGQTWHTHVEEYTKDGKTFKNGKIKKFTFTEIKEIYLKCKGKINKYGKVLGIGYHFQDSKYAGIDLDKMYDKDNNNIMPVFNKVLENVSGKAFIEQSKSGRGGHIYIKINDALGNNKFKFSDLTINEKYKNGLHDSAGIDYFENDLYFVYTGKQIDNYKSADTITYTTNDYKPINDYFKAHNKQMNNNTIVKRKVDYKANNDAVNGVVTSNILEYIYQNINMQEVVNKLNLGLVCNGRTRQDCPLSGHHTGKKRLKYLDGKDMFYCFGEHEKVTIIDLYKAVYDTSDTMTAFKQIDNDFNLNINFKASYKAYCNNRV